MSFESCFSCKKLLQCNEERKRCLGSCGDVNCLNAFCGFCIYNFVSKLAQSQSQTQTRDQEKRLSEARQRYRNLRNGMQTTSSGLRVIYLDGENGRDEKEAENSSKNREDVIISALTSTDTVSETVSVPSCPCLDKITKNEGYLKQFQMHRKNIENNSRVVNF